jgi:hypothetical protein
LHKIVEQDKRSESYSLHFEVQSTVFGNSDFTLEQCCPTFLYIGAHLTDGCGGAGALWRLQ